LFCNFDIASVFAPYRPLKKKKEGEEVEDDLPKSIFERENVFRKPFDDIE